MNTFRMSVALVAFAHLAMVPMAHGQEQTEPTHNVLEQSEVEDTLHVTPSENGTADRWIPLFNGENLDGWTMKINGHELGENPLNTVHVEDRAIKMRYADYERFEDRFGHLFYQQPFENYRLRLEYRFTGEQVPGGPGWAWRNSGVMLHCQDPKTMRQDQPFPVCIEFQFLGGDGTNERATGNVCTPGTHIEVDHQLTKAHVIESKAETYHGDQWVSMEVEVLGSNRIRHYINGTLVHEYQNPKLDANDPDAQQIIDKAQGQDKLGSGYISLQAESHPVEFRAIELMPLNSDGTPAPHRPAPTNEPPPSQGHEH